MRQTNHSPAVRGQGFRLVLASIVACQLLLAAGCSRHGESSDTTPTNLVVQAGDDITASAGAGITLQGSISGASSNATYRWEQVSGPTVVLRGSDTLQPSFDAPRAEEDTTLVFRLVVTDRNLTFTDIITIVLVGTPVQPSPTGKLNDTGITTCGNYYIAGRSGDHNNDLDCSLLTDTVGNPIPPASRIDGTGKPTGQDGHVGRDVTHRDDSDGYAGFSFTKIDKNGKRLSSTAEQWSCVKDNVTGLVWEVKTDDGGLHDKDWTYSWYEPDSRKNGGYAGKQNGGECGSTSQCDTHAYVQAVNTNGWCGAKGWRMPTSRELRSIAVMNPGQLPPPRFEGSLDRHYFPDASNTFDHIYWSSSPIPSALMMLLGPDTTSTQHARAFNAGNRFEGGWETWFKKDRRWNVRLVRDGQ
ncbi:MAG: DUF1566 domain-containing protein [Candidatus Thiothrix putei]|uniref:DUF1566 domain-containing protein n=1 Tax=Candidatus Thiothrix putei TaxID=3080811 RepID=A0AA95HEG4_9GAMM|nr:MAG: DUF1566 domain-containing protein [Candidatus Thiothrix putei]